MFDIIKKKVLTSTNNYALKLLKEEKIQRPTIIITNKQTHGRGQVNNSWHSEQNKSLTLSIILFPKNIPLEKQFVISQIICLALYETLQKYIDTVSIKWPNDIYINDKKTCGILIENAILGNDFAHSICGIGLNVNNEVFPKSIEATSLAIEVEKKINTEDILEGITKNIEKYYNIAEQKQWSILNEKYHRHLYKRNQWLEFEDKEGAFVAKIKGVNTYGQLEIIDKEENLRTYNFKEITFK